MKNIFQYMNEESIMGPGTDLVISLVAVLVVLMSLSMAEVQEQKKELEKLANLEDLQEQRDLMDSVRLHQNDIIQGIAQKYTSTAELSGTNRYQIIINAGKEAEDTIRIYNDATLQRFSFGEKILFRVAKHQLKSEGAEAISTVAEVFKQKLAKIKEIQILGHADNSGDDQVNLKLAALRAIEVFEHLRNNAKIDPIKHLMSASSYGAYMPVQRNIDNTGYSSEKLSNDNRTEILRDKNRRIEIVLIYRGNFIINK